MKNRLMSLYDRIMLRKRSITVIELAAVTEPVEVSLSLSKCRNIETINDELKNICKVEHTRHRAVHNFVMNLISALAAYCFFDKKPAIRCEREQKAGKPSLF